MQNRWSRSSQSSPFSLHLWFLGLLRVHCFGKTIWVVDLFLSPMAYSMSTSMLSCVNPEQALQSGDRSCTEMVVVLVCKGRMAYCLHAKDEGSALFCFFRGKAIACWSDGVNIQEVCIRLQ